MSGLTALDLSDILAAFTIAIIRHDVIVSDDAFKLLYKKFKKKQKVKKKSVQEHVYEMRMAGISYEEIATSMSLRLQTAHTHFSRERKKRGMTT